MQILADTNNDGVMDLDVTYNFDSNALVTSSTRHRLLADEAPELAAIIEYKYENSRLISESVDRVPLGEIEIQRDFTYNDDNTAASVTITDITGPNSAIRTYTYELGLCDTAWHNSIFAFFCVE